VRDKEIDLGTGQVTLNCRDLSAWFDKRLVRGEIISEEEDMSLYAAKVLRSALSADPSPKITLNVAECGVPIDRYYSSEDDPPRIAGEELRELADNGLDFTVINRTLYIRGEEFDAEPVRTLLAEHFLQLPMVKESGNMATRIIGAGQGEDNVSYPDSDLSPDQWEAHPFGLLEQIIDVTAQWDSDKNPEQEVLRATMNRYSIVSAPILYISDGVLHKQAPVSIDQLVPGKRVDVRMEVGGVMIVEQYRLQNVSVSVDGTREEVSITLTALGSGEAEL
jgi:hypothetical protein